MLKIFFDFSIVYVFEEEKKESYEFKELGLKY